MFHYWSHVLRLYEVKKIRMVILWCCTFYSILSVFFVETLVNGSPILMLGPLSIEDTIC